MALEYYSFFYLFIYLFLLELSLSDSVRKMSTEVYQARSKILWNLSHVGRANLHFVAHIVIVRKTCKGDGGCESLDIMPRVWRDVENITRGAAEGQRQRSHQKKETKTQSSEIKMR